MLQRSLKCAIIDDDRADALLLKKFLEKATSDLCEIEIYTDYDAGKNALIEGGQHVAFVDLNLNGESGLDLLGKDMQGQLPFPVIAVSAMADDATQEAAIAAGAYDFIPKDDIDEKTLKRTIRHTFAAFHKEQELCRLAAKERQSSEAKSAFLNCMSHDLRTPLNAIIGFSDMMRLSLTGPLSNDRIEEYSTIISESGRHLLDIINTILDIAKIEQKKFTLVREWIDPGEIILRQIEMLQPLLKEHHLDPIVNINHGSCLLLADPRAFRQIFTNLFSNAVKFSRPGGSIVIDTRVNGEGMDIVVNDRGIGMDSTELKRAQTPFGQVNEDPMLTRQGSGLGLNIVNALMEEHGGNLHIHSRKGTGTRVTISFPVSALSEIATPVKRRQYREQAS